MARRRTFDKLRAPGRPRPGGESPREPAPAAETQDDVVRGSRRVKPAGEVVTIFGFHAVREALLSPRREVLELFATEAVAARLAAEATAKGVSPRIVAGEQIAARLGRDAVHQGALLRARPLAPLDLGDLPDRGLVIVLDQVTDPHNVGAIVRTAAAFGADALVTTERHAPDFGGVLAKGASGGLEHVAIVTITNLARGLGEMGDMGYLRVGLDSEAPTALERVPMRRPVALVLGAEGKGLRRLTRENCDALARIDLPGPIKSLNVSNACVLAMSIVRARLEADGA